MANTKSAEKQAHQAEKRRLRNRAAKSAVKTHIRKVERQLSTEGTAAPEVVRVAVQALDKAAQGGVLHPNNAARRKSRLMRKAARAQAELST